MLFNQVYRWLVEGRTDRQEIRVPHFGYADRIQEIHIKVIHIFMLLIEKMVIEG